MRIMFIVGVKQMKNRAAILVLLSDLFLVSFQVRFARKRKSMKHLPAQKYTIMSKIKRHFKGLQFVTKRKNGKPGETQKL